MRKTIRNCVRQITEEEGLTNLHTISFRKSLPRKTWGRAYLDTPRKNKVTIVFHEDLLDPLRFEREEDYPVWLIILHELSHLKYQNHGKNFHSYIDKLRKKYLKQRQEFKREVLVVLK